MVTGRLMRHAVNEAQKMIRSVACEHKIGMCRCPYDRLFFYQEPGSRCSPWLIVLLASTTRREGAALLEHNKLPGLLL